MKITLSPIGLLALFGLISFSSCWRTVDVEPMRKFPAKADGWAPIYSKDTSANKIRSVDPVPIEKGGKIYVKGNTLYQVENGKGIHVIDISQPEHPKKLSFITVLGAQEMAVKGNLLYANNLNDMVVLDITDISNIKQADRLSNVFHLVDPHNPPASGYFECPDDEKGKVIGWEAKTIDSPKCFNP